MGVAGNQGLYRTTDWLKGEGQRATVAAPRKRQRQGAPAGVEDEAPPPAAVPAVYNYFFPSTDATTFRMRPDGWGRPTIDQNNVELWNHLAGFGADVDAHGLGAAFAGRFRLPAELPDVIDIGFSTTFQHSEQKLIHYLWSLIPGPPPNIRTIQNQIQRILEERGLGADHINRIKLVILHVHSYRDPCLRCRLALSLFALKAQAELQTLLGHVNCRFIVTVSSRMEHDNTRSSVGHGFRYDHPIPIDMGALGALAPLALPLPPPGVIWWQPLPQLAHPLALPVRILGEAPTLIIPDHPAAAGGAAVPVVTGTFNTILPDVPFLDPKREGLPD